MDPKLSQSLLERIDAAVGDAEAQRAIYQDLREIALVLPEVQKDIEEKGHVLIRTLMRLGWPEGLANFFSVRFSRREGKQVPDPPKVEDPNLYHVLPWGRLRQVLRRGLIPNSKPTFTSYVGISAGFVFLTERDGITFWTWRVQDHLEHAGLSERVAVVTVPKDRVRDRIKDEAGTRDAKVADSWKVARPIPPGDLSIASV
jgi:hypothetical protein